MMIAFGLTAGCGSDPVGDTAGVGGAGGAGEAGRAGEAGNAASSQGCPTGSWHLAHGEPCTDADASCHSPGYCLDDEDYTLTESLS